MAVAIAVGRAAPRSAVCGATPPSRAFSHSDTKARKRARRLHTFQCPVKPCYLGRAAMHTEFLAGVVFAWVIAYIGIGVKFGVASFIHRREPEHLLFGLLSLALAIYSIGQVLVLTQTSEADARFATTIEVSGAILANALVVHFAL